MSLSLTWLVDQQLRDLTGAQFKLAAYLYRRLQRKPELTIRAKDLAKATGLSEKSARSTSNHLAKQNIIAVTGGPGTTKTYRLPAAQPAKPGAAKPGSSNTRVRSRRQTAKPAAAPPPPVPEPVTEKPDPKSMAPVVAPPLPRAPSSSSAPPVASTAERPAPLPGKVEPESVTPVVAPQTVRELIEELGLGQKPRSRRKAPKRSRLAKTWWRDAKEATNAELRRPPSTSSSPAPPAAIKVELPTPLPGKIKPESVAPVVTPPATRDVIESGRRPEATGVTQPPKLASSPAPPTTVKPERPAPLPGKIKPESVAPVVTTPVTRDVIESGRRPEAPAVRQPPKPPSSSPAPPAAIKAERPAPLPGKVKPEPVVDSGRTAEAGYQQEIEALLAVVFRPVNPEEQDGLEESAGGKQQLLACLRSFKQQAMSFGRENLNLFCSALVNPENLLQRY